MAELVGGSTVESNLKLDVDPVLIVDKDLSAILALHMGQQAAVGSCIDHFTGVVCVG